MLKQHLDQFVVGQDRAKKVLSVAVYNHYQRAQELQRRAQEEQAYLARQARREAVEGHPLECAKHFVHHAVSYNHTRCRDANFYLWCS